MGNSKDLTGMIFGRLTVIKYVGVNKHQRRLWLCACSCGEVTILPTYHLTRKVEPVRSCGCLGQEIRRKKSTKHGQRHNRIYYVWQNMRRRCYDRTLPQYKDYGGRGLKVCTEWDDFNTFWEWSKKSGYTDKLTIDRINVNGNYCPENCRWVSRKVQNNNKTNNAYLTYRDVTKTRQEWAELYNLNVDHLRVLLRAFNDDLKFIIEEMLNKGYKQVKYQHMKKWKELYKEYKNRTFHNKF